MADQDNYLGSLPIIFTSTQNKPTNFFNNLWLNASAPVGWSSKNFYFGKYGQANAKNDSKPLQLTSLGPSSSTSKSSFSWKSLVPQASSTNTGNPSLYTDVGPLQTAIQNWLSTKNIGTGSGQISPAGLNFLHFTGGRFNLGTSSAAAKSGADNPPNLQNGQDAYFFLEPFIGTFDGQTTSQNFVDFSYIDGFNGGVDLIPWFYDPTTESLVNSDLSSAGFAPIYNIQPGKGASFGGTTVQEATEWLQNNIGPMNASNGSAVTLFTPQYDISPKNSTNTPKKYLRLNQPEYATKLVFDTTIPYTPSKSTNNPSPSPRIYYHDFSKYLYHLQENYLSETREKTGFNESLPWLTISTNTATGYDHQIYNVELQNFSADGESNGNATIEVYCAPTSQIKAWLKGSPVNNENAKKLTFYWDAVPSDAPTSLNTLNSPGDGIYGANPGFKLTNYDSTGKVSSSEYVSNLGTLTADNSAAVWIAADFLAALNYGMPLGKFPESYTADINGQKLNFVQGDYIPPQLWLTETSGVLGDNIFNNRGWGFAKIQDDPNHYNQYAYGISQVAANDYGWAFTDRMQQSVGVNPNPFTYNKPGDTVFDNDFAPEIAPSTSQKTDFKEFLVNQSSNIDSKKLYFNTQGNGSGPSDIEKIKSFFMSNPTTVVFGQPVISAGTTIVSVDTNNGYVELSSPITSGIGSGAQISFAPNSQSLNQLNFPDADLDQINALLNFDAVIASGFPANPNATEITVASVTTAKSLGKPEGQGYVTLTAMSQNKSVNGGALSGVVHKQSQILFNLKSNYNTNNNTTKNNRLYFSNDDLTDLITGLPPDATYTIEGQPGLWSNNTNLPQVSKSDIILGTKPDVSDKDFSGGYIDLGATPYTGQAPSGIPFTFKVNGGAGSQQPFVFLEAQIHEPPINNQASRSRQKTPQLMAASLSGNQSKAKRQSLLLAKSSGRQSLTRNNQGVLRNGAIGGSRFLANDADTGLESLLGTTFGANDAMTLG